MIGDSNICNMLASVCNLSFVHVWWAQGSLFWYESTRMYCLFIYVYSPTLYTYRQQIEIIAMQLSYKAWSIFFYTKKRRTVKKIKTQLQIEWDSLVNCNCTQVFECSHFINFPCNWFGWFWLCVFIIAHTMIVGIKERHRFQLIFMCSHPFMVFHLLRSYSIKSATEK